MCLSIVSFPYNLLYEYFNESLNFEFSLSAGYASIPYRGYIPSDNYEILWRNPEDAGSLHYFGLTKAQVSLVVPIVVNYKKGGGR